MTHELFVRVVAGRFASTRWCGTKMKTQIFKGIYGIPRAFKIAALDPLSTNVYRLLNTEHLSTLRPQHEFQTVLAKAQQPKRKPTRDLCHEVLDTVAVEVFTFHVDEGEILTFVTLLGEKPYLVIHSVWSCGRSSRSEILYTTSCSDGSKPHLIFPVVMEALDSP